MSQQYVVTAHRPSVVTSAVVGSFTGPRDRNLILCKVTRIEVYTLGEEGLQLTIDFTIYGRVTGMSLFKPRDATHTYLLVATDKFRMCALYYENGQIKTKANGDTRDVQSVPSDRGVFLTVDPDCRMVLLAQYDHFMRCIPLQSNGDIVPGFQVRYEGSLVDVKALHGCEVPTVAYLYSDGKDNTHVSVMALPSDPHEASQPRTSHRTQYNIGAATHLIPIPKTRAGVVVLGESAISFLEMSSQNESRIATIQVETTSFVAYSLMDEDGRRILLGDYKGILYVLELEPNTAVPSLYLTRVGETVTPSTLSYLDNGYVYVGSLCGDAQLIRLGSVENGEERLTVVDTFTSLGQATDFVVVDQDKQGQGQIVACCGSGKSGSLRVICNGVGINELAVMEMSGVKGIWAVNAGDPNGLHRLLVVSFINATRVLSVFGESPEEASVPGLISSEPTLLCSDLALGRIVQVTPSAAVLLDGTTGAVLSRWSPPSPGSQIHLAASNRHQLLLGSGAELAYLEVHGDQLSLVATTRLESEVACINVNPVGTDAAATERANFVAVGLWGDNSLCILRLPSLEPVLKQILPNAQVIPRAVLLCDLEGLTYVMCGLGDGHLYTALFHAQTGTLSDLRRVTLGTLPISLALITTGESQYVFASSDRSSVIHSSNRLLLFSTVTLKEVNYMCQLNTTAFPNSVAVASSQGLAIGTIDEVQTLHIKTVPLNETPRRIVHCEGVGAYAVVTIASNANGTEKSYLRLFDDQTYDEICSVGFHENELGTSLTLASLGSPTPYIVVGVALVLPDEEEPNVGRLIVFSPESRRLTQVAELDLKGAPNCICAHTDVLAASENNRILIARLSTNASGIMRLSEETSYSGLILPLKLESRGDLLLVADVMRSVSLLRYSSSDHSLSFVAADMNTLWSTSASFIDDESVMVADDMFNLSTLKRFVPAAGEHGDATRLTSVGEFHVGEQINCIRPGSLVLRVQELEVTTYPSHLFMTPTGSLSLVVTLPQEAFTLLRRVEVNMREVVHGVGGLSHAGFRAFMAREGPRSDAVGYLDGDLIEQFLELSPQFQRAVMEGPVSGAPINAQVGEVTRLIEDMCRLHS